MKFDISNSKFPIIFSLTAIVLLAFFVSGSASGAVPLSSAPIWESSDNDYATGGSLADVDRDGFLELLVSSGNDMAQNRNSVYKNTGGVLEVSASWASSDSGYFGHNAVGDVNNDGYVDMAVAYYGGFDPYMDNIYYNIGDSLESSPSWHPAISDSDNSFDCALGDVDGDGDLDVVFAGGEFYTNRIQRSKLYLNNNGSFDTLASWTSLLGFAYGVAWGDVDRDGDLDLAIGNELGPNHVYYNNGGVLESSPSWESADTAGANQIAFGDVDGDGWLDLAVANTYLPSYCEVYFNVAGTLEVFPSWRSTDSKTRYSCVAFGDVDADGDLDLAAGGWWEPLVVFENFGGILDTRPRWSWYPGAGKALVCENVVWGDVDGDGIVGSCDALDGDGVRKVFYLGHYPAHAMHDVIVDGDTVSLADYCYDLNAGWISFKDPPGSGMANVVICYDYSTDLDLVVTNWDSPTGNFLFDNTTTGLQEYASVLEPKVRRIEITARPNPFVSSTKIDITMPMTHASDSGLAVAVYDVGGRLVRNLVTPDGRFDAGFSGSRLSIEWNGCDGEGRRLPAGTYFVNLTSRSLTASHKLVILR